MMITISIEINRLYIVSHKFENYDMNFTKTI